MDESAQGTTQSADGNQDVDILYLWKIPVDRTYVKSIIGVLKVVIAILSLIAFVCCASGRSDVCDKEFSSTYNYFEFVSISAFLTIISLWFFFVLTLHRRICFKLIPWVFVDLIYCVVYIIMYVIADIVLAAQTCGKGSNEAGAVFGFFTVAAFVAHAVFTFLQWRRSRTQATSESSPKPSPEYSAERNMESY
ncbi:hypothetical protein C0Q70_18776 [Pomacea canaliculata]|uniref:MARVEL domain-containing protein n=1 Tax=Pomacea canaliculata TaxID=400727 RepID=A0A2T7NHJ2_POMCA|nr:CKLF-like MARVEL transmembrane domain-containing protein 4 [Pomacea canaliculata]XP_025116050.1 CKLF-like MARVEL transmembrane domain-containing protein 4 [Pomacea canaliculata]XP_025116051.1 CKLF-like MARVEL transmembrane domain-containing protein 4 [Pomacea canaliculata]PVD20618.1 hypothetical protein C0Q70_18776 [Pomacea canaliculata]